MGKTTDAHEATTTPRRRRRTLAFVTALSVVAAWPALGQLSEHFNKAQERNVAVSRCVLDCMQTDRLGANGAWVRREFLELRLDHVVASGESLAYRLKECIITPEQAEKEKAGLEVKRLAHMETYCRAVERQALWLAACGAGCGDLLRAYGVRASTTPAALTEAGNSLAALVSDLGGAVTWRGEQPLESSFWGSCKTELAEDESTQLPPLAIGLCPH